MSERKARRWFIEINDAVEYLHSLGIAHRDIKLANVLIKAPKGRFESTHRICKLTDFGVSRLSYDKVNERIIMYSNYCGTPVYLAPEIYKWNKLYTIRKDKKPYNAFIGDIWAIGICLYALVSKAYPFDIGKDRDG